MSQQEPPLRADQERVGASVVFSSPQHLQRPRRSKEASAINFLHGDWRVETDGKGVGERGGELGRAVMGELGCAGEGGMTRAAGGEWGGEGLARVEGDGAGFVVYEEDVRGWDGEGPYGVGENVAAMGEGEKGEVEGEGEGGEEEEDDWIKEIRAAWSERKRHGGSKGRGEEDE
ncbi:unnamed protein product [Closterium sp. NIES-65]|nr:unnamed protein product [Closterium sp. NIES-65]